MESPFLTPANDYTYNKEINLKYEEKKYILVIKSNSTIISFSLYLENESLDKYENIYSLKDLTNINKSFSIFNSIEDVRKQIEEILLINKYSIILDTDSQISLILKANIFTQIIDINFILKKKTINQTEFNMKINKQLENLNKEVNRLKNENDGFKKKIEEIQNENKDLKNSIKELKEEIINLKKNIDKDNDIFNFIFKEGKNYDVTKNGKIATRNNGQGFNCTIVGNKEIPKNKITKWNIKINSNILNAFIVGVGPDNPNNEEEFFKECWSMDLHNKRLIIHSGSYSDYKNNKYNDKIKKGDIIGVEMNRINNSLSFNINNQNCGIACSNIPNDIILYPIVILYESPESVEIVD